MKKELGVTAVEEDPKVSICIDCARHPSLKRIIAARSVTGICAFCCRDDVVVRDTDDIEPMVMLLRALIRFYWDEFAYNSHWGGEIGASPKPGHGRLNREGEPVLYLASKGYTALAEIRPHPGHYVSVGGFETLADLKLADFDPDIALFSQNEVRLDLFDIIQAFDRLMSTPVTPDDKGGYLLTQLFAVVLRQKGFDGVQYRSSVSDGVNFCLLDPASAQFVEGHSGVHHVRGITYDAPTSPVVLVPGFEDYELKS
ncbi:MAG: RES family NAD+ phosphorylase [Alphaproteobacteria bacterium]|nr:RES family NAD+ phosphorylase [Alphaproteobacteria bacterium]MBU0864320.1 RES family NAD+ phosphorylase [Alphaproteobacteria bacterium]